MKRMLTLGTSVALQMLSITAGAADRLKLESFSVQPPAGSGWQRKTDQHSISIGRSIDGNPLHTFGMIIREYPPLPEPVGSINNILTPFSAAAKKEAQLPGRYLLTNHSETITQHLNMSCIKYEKKWKDQGGSSTGFRELIMAAHGLICIHPTSERKLVEVSYSHRSPSGVLSAKLEKKGKSFLQSLMPLE